MFADVEHKFRSVEHKFKAVEYKFKDVEYKNWRIEKTFVRQKRNIYRTEEIEKQN